MHTDANKNRQFVSTNMLCKTALCTAIVFLMTFVPRIPIPLGYAHLGDAVIFLLILVLPKRPAAVAAAVGSAFSDMAGGFPVWIVPTLIIKWIMVEIVFLFWPKAGGSAFAAVRAVAGFVASAVWMVLSYAAFGAALYGSLAAGVSMVPGLICEGVVNVVVAGGAFLLLKNKKVSDSWKFAKRDLP